MYIPPFLCGVVATLIVEILIIVIAALMIGRKK